MAPRKNLNGILQIKKLVGLDKKKDQFLKAPEPIISLATLDQEYFNKLFDSIAEHYAVKATTGYFHLYYLLTNHPVSTNRFNNEYQLVRLYKKRERVFTHGYTFFSLIKRGRKFLKRNVFMKELPVLDYEIYLSIVEDFRQADPRFPNYFGNKMSKMLYTYNNPSYIDIFCHYLCSRLVEVGRLPNFPLFYGVVGTYFNKWTHKFDDDKELSDFLEDHGDVSEYFRVIDQEERKKIEIKGMPVMLMATEQMDFDMAELIERSNDIYLNSLDDSFDKKEYEETIASVLFQVMASLSVVQNLWTMYHNDLHIGNVMFKRTKEEFIYYCFHGSYYKIPTFGAVTKIIDWNRATLKFGETELRNSVYDQEGECGSMYIWPKSYGKGESTIEPNPSFDLAILAFEIITNDKIINRKGKLYKLLLDLCHIDNGNTLIGHFGKDEEPGFELYRVIASDCHKAIPENQLGRAFWNQYKIDKSNIPKDKKIYVIL